MEKDELRKRIYSKIDELPTLPAALPRLLSLIEDSRTNSSQIAEVISRDPALTSKILEVNEEELEDIKAHLQDVQEGVHAFYNAMS